ncbi:MAG: hypothetical protein JSU04_20185 [Bdellovibrionales bacterium]|nr:hypothetical protein [Bdellovibrionales bacterium]
MKFSLVNGERQEAAKGLSGICIGCSQPMIPKCGSIKIWHWAHKGARTCDPWWENETEWHRNWKSRYPVEWQEVVHHSESGEKHIADIKTNLGWVVEIQHSYLDPSERKSREDFYKKLIWVVDGKRRKRDYQKFIDAINYGGVVSDAPLFIRKLNSHDCALVGDWADSDVPVFFDFGDRIRSGESEIEVVWWLLPKDSSGKRNYIMLESKLGLVQRLRDDVARVQEFEAILNEFATLVRVREELELKRQTILERRRNRFLL